MKLSFRHLTSAKQLTKKDMDIILEVAAQMESVLKKGGDDRLKGKILGSLFYEPSTRTRLSFESAMQRLGGSVITAEGLQFSSMYKGETIEDTMKVIGQYADIITMRHPEEGSADKAASVCPVSFINAGDGPGQHPTQAILDVYTVERECGRIKDLNVAVVGDLKFGRAARSFVKLLSLYPNISFTFVAPDALKMPDAFTKELTEAKVHFSETSEMAPALEGDIVYMTRVQKERFQDAAEYEKLKDVYILKADHLQGKKVKVLHPLPRVNEISTEVDALANAAYFRQVHSGLVTRMALLALLLEAA